MITMVVDHGSVFEHVTNVHCVVEMLKKVLDFKKFIIINEHEDEL